MLSRLQNSSEPVAGALCRERVDTSTPRYLEAATYPTLKR